MTLERVVERVNDGGNLLANVAHIYPNTWQTSQEVWKASQLGDSVMGVTTANMGIYRLDNGKPVFNLLGREGNLFIDEKFREDAYNGIVNKKFFFPSEAMKQHIMVAIHNRESVTVRYSGLRVNTKDCSPNFGYVEIDGKNTAEDIKLFVAVYGTDDLSNGKRVYLLREDVVKDQLKGRKEDDVIAWACFFNFSQNFGANGGNTIIHYCAVRGVRRENVVKGDASKVQGALQDADSIRTAYDTLGRVTSDEAARKLQPVDAANLASILVTYTQFQAGQ